MHSSAALCVLDRRKCARVNVTALKTHGIAGEAMAAKATRALRAIMAYVLDRWYTRSLVP